MVSVPQNPPIPLLLRGGLFFYVAVAKPFFPLTPTLSRRGAREVEE